MSRVIAVACSDVHLSEKVPVARQGEKNWIEKQKEALQFVTGEAFNLDVPLIIAGDLFHKAKTVPVVETMAMKALSACHCLLIPGQHDLPNHSYNNLHQSSYGLIHTFLSITQKEKELLFSLELFPYDSDIRSKAPKDKISVAVIHDLIWNKEPPYPGAPESGNVKELTKKMKGYTFIVCGDNHKGFVTKSKGTTIVNCGSLIRRSADQEDYIPCCYLLHEDGDVTSVPMPIKKDSFTRDHRDIENRKDSMVESFVSRLQEIEMDLSFENNLDRYCKKNKIREEVISLLKETIND